MKNNQKNECIAIAMIFLCQILFPSSYIYVTEHNFSMAEIFLLRGLVLMVVCLIIAKKKQVNLQRSIRVHFKDFLIRNSLVIIHSNTLILCHYYLSLSVVHTINSVGPIFVFIFDFYLYGVTINRKQFIGIVLGVIGIILTVNSVQIYVKINSNFISGSTFEHYRYTTIAQTLLYGFFLVIANALWAYSASMIKTVKMKDSSQMNFHLAILLIIVSGLTFFLFQTETKSLDVYAGALMLSLIPMALGQVLFVTSLTLSRNTGILTLFISLSIIVGYFFSLIRYHQNINPIAVIGSILIVAGLAIVVLCKNPQSIQLRQQQ